jgi:branched-chain amino acid aminotransferase
LPGITREAVIELARASEISIKERYVEQREIYQADEVFLTTSIRELVPVITVDKKIVGSGKPGPVTLKLARAYKSLVRDETSRIRKAD